MSIVCTAGALSVSFTRDPGDDPEGAFGTHDHGAKVEAYRVRSPSTDLHDVPVDGDHLDTEDVGNSRPVGKAVWTTGVGTHVASDGAGSLRRGIRGEVDPERFDLL